ncbi:MAG: serine/threonine dehydratase [Candidatus Tectimicrobiota bacterium]|nr:MAG: serine/threonine dehydratase [Candidatus Tectomicrobia bacterium]
MSCLPTFADVERAAARIGPFAHRTPVWTCASLDRLSGARLFFKCENLQKAGAFKFRGACNAVMALPEAEARRGVATHSSGNHAAALALAARLRGIAAHVVMPASAPAVKKAAVAAYGGRIVFCAPTLEAREETLARVVAETGATFVHPYNDPLVIAGQGTAALELCQEVPHLDAVLVPVGGGGLASGTALAVAAVSPQTQVIGVEPATADDACRALQAGKLLPAGNPRTVADGLRTALGELTFALLRQHAVAVVTVSEAAIVDAMRHVWERLKLIIEPSAAVAVAALLAGAVYLPGRRVGVILSGGNVDLDRLPWPPRPA